MDILKLLLFFLSILLPGYLLLALFFDQASKGLLKKLGLAFGLGCFWLASQLFIILFIIKARAGVYLGWLWAAEDLLLIIFYWRKFGFDWRVRYNFTLKNFTASEIILIILNGWQIISALALAWLKPVATYDSLTMWTLKAKTLWMYQRAVFDQMSAFYWAGQSHANYPWLVPLVQFWQSLAVGRFDDVLINFIFVGFYFSLLAVFYGSLRHYLSRQLSLLFTFFLSSLPLVFFHSYNAYADLPLAFYILVAFIFLFKWLEMGEKKYLVIAGLFFAAALFTKNEAIFFFLAAWPIVCLKVWPAKNWRAALLFGAAALLPLIPWWWFMLANKLSFSNIGGAWGWHPEVIGKLISNFSVTANWNIFWFIFLLLTMVFIRQIFKRRYLWLAFTYLLLIAAELTALYLFTETYQFVIDGTAVSRNLIPLTVLAVFLAAQLFRQEIVSDNKLLKN